MRLMGGIQVNNDMQIPRIYAGARMNQSIAFGKLASTPRGTQPPYSWIRSKKSGDFSTYKNIIGEGEVSFNLLMGQACSASLTGNGTIPDLSMSMAYHLAASIVASGSISAASMKGIIQFLAELTGQGTVVTSPLDILAWCLAALEGSGEISSATLLSPVGLSANLTGQGSITSAALVGMVLLMAELAGQGAISPDLRFPANMASALSGEGSLESALNCLAWCVAEIIGAGTLYGSDLRGKSFMEAEITSAGELVTAQTCAQAVWNAIAASFNEEGTLGAKLNDAGGSNSPEDIADAVRSELTPELGKIDTIPTDIRIELTPELSKIDDTHSEALNKWILDMENNLLTYYEDDGITILRQFNLQYVMVSGNKVYIGRTPI